MNQNPQSMPILFLGHGSPMNIVWTNSYTEEWGALGKSLPKPKAIVIVSAHWRETVPTVSSAMEPKTIYDFGGFPPELYTKTYPCKGAPELANRIVQLMDFERAKTDDSMGLDHGAWSLLFHLFPKADIPCLQIAISKKLTLREHYELAKKLAPLADEGCLILGSGNVVHNLGEIAWEENAPSFAWAVEFEASVHEAITRGGADALFAFLESDNAKFRQAHPTTEHFIPLVYALGAAVGRTKVTPFCRGVQNGSISMLGFRWDK